MKSEQVEEGDKKNDIFQWNDDEADEASTPNPKYNILTEQAQSLISLKNQCILFCGGRNCKYERSDCWEGRMAIKGLFSHWVNDDILAMARPNTAAMKEFNIVEQFCRANIKSVINLQEIGEHASCGSGLEPSGFSYNPQDFMSEKIFFYNFACPDYGTMSKCRLLDIVRVIQFAVTEGKVAIHCHAGLGRTGLLICCYLVFVYRISANRAITYLRSKRPKSIQTRKQMLCLRQFVDFLKKLWIVFPYTSEFSCEFTLQQYMSRQRKLLHGNQLRHLKHIPQIIYYICERLLELAGRGSTATLSPTNKDFTIPTNISNYVSEEETVDIPYMGQTSSVDHLTFQGDVLQNDRPSILYSNMLPMSFNSNCDNDAMDALEYHALEQLDSITKSKLCYNDSNLLKGVDTGRNVFLSDTNPMTETSKYKKSNKEGNHCKGRNLQKRAESGNKPRKETLKIANVLSETMFPEKVILQTNTLKHELNNSDNGWKLILAESNPEVLVALLWEWLNRLQEPILRYRDLKSLLTYGEDPFLCLSTLEKSPHATINYLNKVVVQLLPLPEMLLNHLLEVLLSHLTHHYISLDPCNTSWKNSDWLDLYNPTPLDLINFFKCLLHMNWGKMLQNTPATGC